MKSVSHETNLFCWRRGFTAEDLGSHPCADDLVLMTVLKDELGDYLSNSEHCWLNGIWGMVYSKKFPLKNKHRERIEDITKNAIEAEHRQQQQMAKIKQFRKATV
jgi:hypothetical protein